MVRKLIADRLAELGLQMKDVSLRIGRNDTYLHQFMKRGVPAELRENERRKLAEILRVHEDQLRGPSTTLPKRPYVRNETSSRKSIVDHRTQSNYLNGDVASTTSRTIPGTDLFGAGQDLPVFGTAQGGPEGALSVTDRAVDWVARPAVLLRVQDGYGIIVTGDSMEPVVRPGSTMLVNPHLPARVDDLCIFRRHSDDGTTHILVKEYRGQSETLWKVRQYNPPRDFALKKSEWQVCHRSVGNYFP